MLQRKLDGVLGGFTLVHALARLPRQLCNRVYIQRTLTRIRHTGVKVIRAAGDLVNTGFVVLVAHHAHHNVQPLHLEQLIHRVTQSIRACGIVCAVEQDERLIDHAFQPACDTRPRQTAHGGFGRNVPAALAQ